MSRHRPLWKEMLFTCFECLAVIDSPTRNQFTAYRHTGFQRMFCSKICSYRYRGRLSSPRMVRANPMGCAAIRAKVSRTMKRLALVYACSAAPSEPVIDADAARWACAVSGYLTQRLLHLASHWVAEGEFDARQKKVLRIIRDAGGVIGHSDLYNRTRSLTPRERQEVLENLIQTGQMEVRTENTATRPRVTYVAR